MLILRMRQAETALKDGRLDEAFELVRSADVREHRRGQELIGRLARALAARGNEHLSAGRWPQAAADGEKAAELGGNLPEVAVLKSALHAAATARQEQERLKAGALGAAREHMRNGDLTIVQQRLESVQDTHRAELLRGEVAGRRQEADALLARAEDALRHEQWSATVELLVKVHELHPTNPRLTELTTALTADTLPRVRAAVQQGRLDQARTLLAIARPVCAASLDFAELHNVVELCGKAAAAMTCGHARRAVELLQRVRAMMPSAAWLAETLADAQHAAEASERISGGPLGLLMNERSDGEPQQAVVRVHTNAKPQATGMDRRGIDANAPTVHIADEAHASANLPRRWMLHVDGVGSFLVLRERAVTIGAAGGSRRPDVPLLIDGSVPAVTIERMDEDYFLSATQPVTVNNAAISRKVLSTGDRLALSHKCHIRFTVPNAACTSALLSIAGGRMPGTDACRAILLDRSLVIGPGESAHIRADNLTGPVVLHVRDGRLFCNTTENVLVDGRSADRQEGLPMGARVQIGPVSMTIGAA